MSPSCATELVFGKGDEATWEHRQRALHGQLEVSTKRSVSTSPLLQQPSMVCPWKDERTCC